MKKPILWVVGSTVTGLAAGTVIAIVHARRANTRLALAPPRPARKGDDPYVFNPWTSEARKKRLAKEFMTIRSPKIKDFVPDSLPSHVRPFADYMARASKQAITPRDVAKAYIMTVGSMRRAAINASKVKDRWPGYPGPGSGKVRPEDALGELLKSPAGQRYLDAAERGDYDAKAAKTLAKRFGAWGFQPTFQKQLKHAVALAKDAPTINRIIKKGNRPTWYRYVKKHVPGVSVAKSGFLASLWGRGDIATADARELNFWLCAPNNWDVKKRACKRPLAKKFDLNDLVDQDFMDVFNKKIAGLKMKMPAKYKPFKLHLTHHALWDRVGGTKTTHNDIIDAMKNA